MDTSRRHRKTGRRERTPLVRVKAVDFAIIPIFDVVDASMRNDLLEDAVHQALVEGVRMASQVVE